MFEFSRSKSVISIYNDDCLNKMRELIDSGIKVDSIITDIPYGTTSCNWDCVIPFEEMWELLYKIKKDKTSSILLFGQEPFSSNLRVSNIKDFKYDIYWEKERPTNVLQLKRRPGKVIETISVFYEKQCYYDPQKTLHEGKLVSNKVKNGKLGGLIDNSSKKPKEYVDDGTRYPLQIVKYKRDILTSNLHPTQKPIALMEYLVKTYTKEGDTVLDFTMGSGTTGLACKNLNRNFIGIEKDVNYFNIAKERLL